MPFRSPNIFCRKIFYKEISPVRPDRAYFFISSEVISAGRPVVFLFHRTIKETNERFHRFKSLQYFFEEGLGL
jgi:hypothetical protein